MNQQTVVFMKDLRFASLLCAQCNTRVTLDLEAVFESPRRISFAAPRECPRCNSRFDSALPAAVEAMQKVYQAVAELGNAVTFTGDPLKPV